MDKKNFKSKSYLLLEMLGSPLLKGGSPISLYESEDLFNHAFKNRIGLFYLDSLCKAGKLNKLKGQYKELKERERETFITASRASKILSDDQVKHVVIKTLRPYPATPNDVDVLSLGGNDFFLRGKKALEANQYLFVHESNEQCGYCDPRGRFLKVEERPKDDKYAGGKYFIDFYRNLSADHFHYIDKRLLLDSIVSYSPFSGVEFLTLNPPVDLLVILMHSIFPHQRYGIESFYTTTYWLAEANSVEITRFGELASKHKLKHAASIYFSITIQIHKEIFGFVPEKLRELVSNVGLSEYEIKSFKSTDRELPYVFSKRNVLLVLLQKMREFNAFKTMTRQFISMLKPTFLFDVLKEIKEKRSKDHYRQL